MHGGRVYYNIIYTIQINYLYLVMRVYIIQMYNIVSNMVIIVLYTLQYTIISSNSVNVNKFKKIIIIRYYIGTII